jgi:two-component system, cell cycle sensor histidine kinase and response regulator CckA
VPRDIVLVVDDEPIVLRSCTVAVTQAGFRTVVAENGAAGLETFIALQDEICLVLSDIIMPAVNGIEMAQKILKISPETKILLMSGYSNEVIELQGRNRFPFIRKPFIHTMLVDKIRSIIGTSADSAASAT